MAFSVAENLLPVLASNRRNARRMQTCSEGWAYLDQTVWPKLDPFEDFARSWYGFDAKKKLQRQIFYNDTNNRMDICLRCPETKVGIDFVFEPGYPVPEVPKEFWFRDDFGQVDTTFPILDIHETLYNLLH
jgi:hypothetical protein